MNETIPGIHIIPTGFEYDRIVLPMLKDYNVKKGYILINKPGRKFSEQRSVINGYIKKLEELPFDHEKVEMDFYDFDDTFQKVFPIASLNENEYRALDILMKRGQVDSIKELIEILKQDGDEKVARSSIRYSLQRLEALGLIRMRQERKKVVIEATKAGELYGKTSCKNINILG